MTTNLDLAKVVAIHVEILAVVLRRASTHASINPLQPPPEVAVNQSHRASYSRDGLAPKLEVELDFEFRAMDESKPESPVEVCKLQATFLLVYSLPEGREFPQESLEHFAWLNGTYNAWPYWRELVQSAAGRIGLAGVTIPVYRPAVKKIAENPKAVAAAS